MSNATLNTINEIMILPPDDCAILIQIGIQNPHPEDRLYMFDILVQGKGSNHDDLTEKYLDIDDLWTFTKNEGLSYFYISKTNNPMMKMKFECVKDLKGFIS